MSSDNSEIKLALSELRKDVHNVDKTLTEHKVTLDIRAKQDETMMEELKRMNDILMINTSSLKEHMHRTELLEDAIIKMDERLNPIEIDRIKKQAVNSWIKDNAIIIGKIAAGLAALFAAYQAIKSFIH